ncbi:MAG: phospholipid carrier-dependent glycosyltransferase [Anaerolineales bacterium]|nr:phospholipid carrier-dependent glycosyltransferase [Anaerolineales bacterium]
MTLSRSQKKLSVWLISLALFVVVLLPRLIGLDSFIAIDEARWVYRSAFFWRAVLAGNFAQATSDSATPGVETLAPGVPVMWLGGLGLIAKAWTDPASPVANVSDYLALVPRKTEIISLDFYAWTRRPFVLLSSLFLALFYLLLSQLIKPGVALVAALLLAFDPFLIGLSRLVHTDMTVCMTLNLSLLTLLYYRWHSRARSQVSETLRGRVSRPIWWLLLSGGLAGLALATKPTALYLFVFVALFLLFEQGWPRRWADWRRAMGEGVVWGVVALLAVIVIWPALWVAAGETLQRVFSGSGFESEENPSLLPYLDYPVPQLGFLFYPTNWLFKSTLPQWIGLLGLFIGLKQGWFRRAPVADSSLSADAPFAPPLAWTVKWLAIFVILFFLLLAPAATRDLRYAAPAFPGLYTLAAVGLWALAERLGCKLAGIIGLSSGRWRTLALGLLAIIQIWLAALYFPYYFNYLNPVAGGKWLAPHLIKIGSGEGLDHMAYYLNQQPDVAHLTVATSLWDTFVPFYQGRYTKAHYDDEADYILIYLRQIQNRNPFPEFWPYFAARTPEYVVRLTGLDYAWLYPGPQLREVNDAVFGDGLILRGYRLDKPAAQPDQPANLTLVWGGASPELADQTVRVQVSDEAGQIWAESTGSVLDAGGPSPVEGHYILPLPGDIGRGNYQLRVSREVPAGKEESFLAGTIKVRQLDKPPAQFAAAANFGNLINFGGANVTLTEQEGAQLEVQFCGRPANPFPSPILPLPTW